MTAGAAEANGGRSLEHAMSEVDLGFANDALPVSGSPGGSMRGTKCGRPRSHHFCEPMLPRDDMMSGVESAKLVQNPSRFAVACFRRYFALSTVY